MLKSKSIRNLVEFYFSTDKILVRGKRMYLNLEPTNGTRIILDSDNTCFRVLIRHTRREQCLISFPCPIRSNILARKLKPIFRSILRYKEKYRYEGEDFVMFLRGLLGEYGQSTKKNKYFQEGRSLRFLDYAED